MCLCVRAPKNSALLGRPDVRMGPSQGAVKRARQERPPRLTTTSVREKTEHPGPDPCGPPGP